MPFIGNQPAEAFSSFQKQDFTTSATTSYTLDHPVANANEIALFINFVRQEPTAAYTASGTSLTLTSATSSSDDMYCVYLGKAVQTVNPPNSSVGSSQVSADLITGQTALGATPADTDELLISDAGTLKRVDYSYLKSANTPAFSAFLTSGQTVATNTWTKLSLSNEEWDTNNAYDPSTNYRFTVPSGEGGKYLFTYAGGTETLSNSTISQVRIYKNGSALDSTIARSYPNTSTGGYPHKSIVLNLSASDYIELYGQHTKGSDSIFDQRYTFLQGQKLIGV